MNLTFFFVVVVVVLDRFDFDCVLIVLTFFFYVVYDNFYAALTPYNP